MPDAAVAADEGIDRKGLKQIRQRFLRLGQRRLKRIDASLSRPQQQFVTLLPLLFHSNHPLLPGFVSRDTPAGIADFEPSRNQVLAARALAKTYAPPNPHRECPIRGLYLMGSLGTLGQEPTSDLDIWLCHDAALPTKALTLLADKARRIEHWGASLGLEVHIFAMQAEAFRDGSTTALSDESSGGIQIQLLREEFYRTGILLGGLPPLWWLVPPEAEDQYDSYTGRLIQQRFIKSTHWLDFGGLQGVSPAEFYGAARWQLLKGIDTPYKSILKLMLFEVYAQDWPDVRWIGHQIKSAVYSGNDLDIDTLDPYWLIMERITAYLEARDEPERLALARRALYVKAGQFLSRPVRNASWRRERMQALIASWGWDDTDLYYMDTRQQWKLDRVQRERDALVDELSRCYRLLTGFARQHGELPSPDARELSMVGRKLYAVLERRPGKVERINPAISNDLSEETLWIERSGNGDSVWQLYREPPDARERRSVKSGGGLVELLAWIHLNGLADAETRLVVSPRPEGVAAPEHERIFKVLQRHLRADRSAFGALETFSGPARLRASLLFVNVGIDPLADLSRSGLHRTSARDDPYSYGASHTCLVRHVDHLYLTSWGEVRCHHFGDGMSGLLAGLCQQAELGMRDPDDAECAEIEFHCFTSNRATAIETRTRHLAQALAHCVADADAETDTRLLTRAGDQLYLIRREQERVTWVALDDEAALHDLLGEPGETYRTLVFDDYALTDSPLRAIYAGNRRGAVDLFFRTDGDGIDLWILDESGCLFHQRQPGAPEHHFLSQQKRFFDGLESALLLSHDTGGAAVPVDTRMYRLRREAGSWYADPVEPRRETPPDYLELLLLADGQRPERGEVTFVSGQRQFSSGTLGADLYPVVARFVLDHRDAPDHYPIYLTGVLTGHLDSRRDWPLARILRLKRRLEKRLWDAVQNLTA